MAPASLRCPLYCGPGLRSADVRIWLVRGRRLGTAPQKSANGRPRPSAGCSPADKNGGNPTHSRHRAHHRRRYWDLHHNLVSDQ